MSSPLSISVVVATYGRDAELRGIVEQLLCHDYPRFEVVLVDQVPRHDEQTCVFLESVTSRVRYFVLQQPNTVHAEAFGVEQATGDIVLFLDDDVVMPADLLTRHAENYQDLSIQGVGGLVLHRGESPVEALHPLCERADVGYYFFSHAYARRIEVANARGCNMSFRREAILRVGGFDKRFRTHQWELDLCRRIHQAGGKIVHDPRASVLHLASPRAGSRGRHGDAVSLLADFHLFLHLHHPGKDGAFLRWRLFRDRVLGSARKNPLFAALLTGRYFLGWAEARRRLRSSHSRAKTCGLRSL
jgi:GT2 family glycosyltransferase